MLSSSLLLDSLSDSSPIWRFDLHLTSPNQPARAIHIHHRCTLLLSLVPLQPHPPQSSTAVDVKPSNSAVRRPPLRDCGSALWLRRSPPPLSVSESLPRSPPPLESRPLLRSPQLLLSSPPCSRISSSPPSLELGVPLATPDSPYLHRCCCPVSSLLSDLHRRPPLSLRLSPESRSPPLFKKEEPAPSQKSVEEVE